MNRRYLLVLACAVLLGADTAKKDEKSDADKVKGNWKAVSGEVAGNPLPEEFLNNMKMTFADGKYTYTGGGDEEEGTFKLDAAKKPKTIDLMITKGNDKDKKQFGIYELDGDTLKFCFAPPEKERPKEFKTGEGSEHILIVLKREK